mmetsp:Transcript_18556/g.46804  ORF Transcript_18556/g.46804 Transcript_18556/m.46804 type:complete len:200 (+) Transcript_18556:400-999(+)
MSQAWRRHRMLHSATRTSARSGSTHFGPLCWARSISPRAFSAISSGCILRGGLRACWRSAICGRKSKMRLKKAKTKLSKNNRRSKPNYKLSSNRRPKRQRRQRPRRQTKGRPGGLRQVLQRGVGQRVERQRLGHLLRWRRRYLFCRVFPSNGMMRWLTLTTSTRICSPLDPWEAWWTRLRRYGQECRQQRARLCRCPHS